jgi:hypothetical protein
MPRKKLFLKITRDQIRELSPETELRTLLTFCRQETARQRDALAELNRINEQLRRELTIERYFHREALRLHPSLAVDLDLWPSDPETRTSE